MEITENENVEEVLSLEITRNNTSEPTTNHKEKSSQN